jgi:hypothetical protein
MSRMFAAEAAVFVHFQTVGIVLFVFHGIVVSLLAFAARQCNSHSH